MIRTLHTTACFVGLLGAAGWLAAADTADKAVLEPLIRGLKGKTAERVRAAQELAKLGEKAKPAAKALCTVAVESEDTPKTLQAALEALEKVWPELYAPVVVLLRDKTDDFGRSKKRVDACKTIAELEGGEAGLPVLHHHLKEHITKDNDFFQINDALKANVGAITKLSPNDARLLQILTDAADKTNRQLRNRAFAIEQHGTIGEEQPKQRPKLKKLFNATLANYMTNKTERGGDYKQIALAAIKALAKFGADAKPELVGLRKLKLDSDEDVRKAAAEAVETIELAK